MQTKDVVNTDEEKKKVGEDANPERIERALLCVTRYYGFRVDGFGFDIRRLAFSLCIVARVCGLAAPFDKDMTLEGVLS